MKKSVKYHPIDIYVGKKLRFKRMMVGFSQADLAKRVDLTFQQIQKYEKGENRISASKLYEIAQALNCQVSYFFEGYNKKPVVETSFFQDIPVSYKVNFNSNY